MPWKVDFISVTPPLPYLSTLSPEPLLPLWVFQGWTSTGNTWSAGALGELAGGQGAHGKVTTRGWNDTWSQDLKGCRQSAVSMRERLLIFVFGKILHVVQWRMNGWEEEERRTLISKMCTIHYGIRRACIGTGEVAVDMGIWIPDTCMRNNDGTGAWWTWVMRMKDVSRMNPSFFTQAIHWTLMPFLEHGKFSNTLDCSQTGSSLLRDSVLFLPSVKVAISIGSFFSQSPHTTPLWFHVATTIGPKVSDWKHSHILYWRWWIQYNGKPTECFLHSIVLKNKFRCSSSAVKYYLTDNLIGLPAIDTLDGNLVWAAKDYHKIHVLVPLLGLRYHSNRYNEIVSLTLCLCLPFRLLMSVRRCGQACHHPRVSL